jgi:long-chain fatty acid transport protein
MFTTATIPHDFRTLLRLAGLFSLFGLFSGRASGAGIAIMEQSVKELSQAFAGATSNIDDGSMVFFNPGAMGQLHGGLVSLSGHIILPSATFRDAGSSLSPALGGASLRGGSGGDAGVTTGIPNFYYVQDWTERLVFGFGVNAPFGVHSRYDSDWQGRYQAIESKIDTVNINPVFALRITNALSFGAGIDVQYLHAKLTNAVDFGTICFQVLGPSACGRSGLLPQQADGQVRLEGDSIGVGYNLGILYAPTADTRLGVSYRSAIHHQVEGDADYNIPTQVLPLTRAGQFIDTSIRSPITLPDTVSFGFYHRFAPQWAISADALWTHWSPIQSLTVKFSSAQPDSVQRLDWQDTWRYALGLSYLFTPATTFRIGVAYDETPIPNRQRRTPRIPDSNRIWLAAGVSFSPADNLTVHGAYAHLFFNGAPITNTGPTGDNLNGKFYDTVDIVGLQLDWRF